VYAGNARGPDGPDARRPSGAAAVPGRRQTLPDGTRTGIDRHPRGVQCGARGRINGRCATWSSDRVGPQRRDYVLTESGFAALHEWAAVMRERTRLIAEFDELHRRVHLERPG